MIPTTKPLLSWKECQTLLNEKARQLQHKFPAYGFSAGKIGSRLNLLAEPVGPMWGSIFVTTIANIQIGRLIFRDGIFDHSKIYGVSFIRKVPTEKLLCYEIWSSLEEEVR